MPKLFIVDDEEYILRSLSRVLNRAGYEPRPFTCGVEAVAAAVGDQPPDLILCDYHMPGVDGVQVAAAVKAVHPTTRVLIVTGGVLDERLCDALNQKTVERVVFKPWSIDQLLSAVEAVLAGR